MTTRWAWVVPMLLLLATQAARAKPLSEAELAARIDDRLAEAWKAAGITPAGRADDAAFHRRVSLDLVGRIPTVSDARAFLDDRSPGKRERLVDCLLASPLHAAHFASVWRKAWVPQTSAPAFARLGAEFEIWAEARLRDGVPYDRIVLEQIAPPRSAGGRPRLFWEAGEFKPENLAANAARAFLGVNLDCAQCHNHPFARWTRDQFWETAAFFARPDGTSRPRIGVGAGERVVGPKPLTDVSLRWPDKVTSLTGPALFAGWVTARDNPFFARNLANRLWAQLFGTGLVEPLDDLGGEGLIDHPKLLDDLAAGFADRGYDLKALTRTLVLTRAYQLSSDPPAGRGPPEPKYFARSVPRGLTGEQIHDSIRTACGQPVEPKGSPARKRFAAGFHAEREATAQRSVIQSLTLMNGSAVASAVDPASSPILASADAPFFDTRGRVELLFLAALSRPPSATELSRLTVHIEKAGTKGRRRALAAVLWALLNTTEFTTNH